MIAVVDYGMGNVGSILNMLRKLGAPATLTADPAVLAAADRLILPGVGAFDTGMSAIAERGLAGVLGQRRRAGVPILGVCLGMQLMCRGSEEGGRPGLGWIDARVTRFAFSDPALKVPHMGWNTISVRRPHPLVEGLTEGARFYFVHSYHVTCADEADAVASTDYGHPFTSIVARENVAGVQFHPEKSHRFGMALLANFAGHPR